MEVQELHKKLIRERLLLKQLVALDHKKYGHLLPRIEEIKLEINTTERPISTVLFSLYDDTLAEHITQIAQMHMSAMREFVDADVHSMYLETYAPIDK